MVNRDKSKPKPKVPKPFPTPDKEQVKKPKPGSFAAMLIAAKKATRLKKESMRRGI